MGSLASKQQSADAPLPLVPGVLRDLESSETWSRVVGSRSSAGFVGSHGAWSALGCGRGLPPQVQAGDADKILSVHRERKL